MLIRHRERSTGTHRRRLRGIRALRVLGPGLVSGAADVDPTTVATMAVVGAGTVYALSWLAWLTFPMLAVVLLVATRIGAAARQDLQRLLRRRYGRVLRWSVLVSVVAVNIVTVAADVHGGAAALGLLVGHDTAWFVLPVAAAALALLLWGSLAQVQRVLRYVLLCLLAYPVAAVLARPDWGQVLVHTVVPHLSWNATTVSSALAMLGTTLTAYVYLWQVIEVAEERPSRRLLRYRGIDALVGMLFTVVIFWFVLVATGATLGVRHERVATAEDAARSLAPVAGRYAGDVFGVGLLAAALVALPVLLETSGHVIAGQFDQPRGPSEPVRRAPIFYGAVLATTVAGVAVTATGVTPIRLLFVASIVGGIATPVGLVALMRVAGDPTVMGDRVVRGGLRVAGWVVTAVMSALSLGCLVQQLTAG